ncbi:MAG: MBL fold metallo-hydrolase [Ardenticatenaceae bacterium]|nr:MBL fold metallo-hydrolase [Ardenticatenaceae bacterium]
MKIHTLDLNYQNIPQTIAAYLVMGDEPVLVETGPGSTLANLLARLASYGIRPMDVKHVLVTHIHLDHAGAAGWWAQQGAQVYVHPLGAPHLIDPSKLLASAGRIYGDKMDMLWGETVAAPAERVTIVQDNDQIRVAGLTFTAVETPGHAYHHHVYRVEDIAIMGDLGGIHLPGSKMIDLPAPPPEFHMEKWLESLDRILAEDLRRIYLVHFGEVTQVREHLLAMKALVGETAVFIHQQMEAGLEQAQIITNYEHWNRERARQLGIDAETISQYETANPWYMSVQGVMRYWRKRQEGKASAK